MGPASVSRGLPLHHLSLQGPSRGMHLLRAPQHSPVCPAPGQHGSLLAGMEGWQRSGTLLVQPQQSQAGAITPPRELWRSQTVAPE